MPFNAPTIDYHALAPEIILASVAVLVLIADAFLSERRKYLVTQLAGVGVLLAFIPIVTLAFNGADRRMFGGAYVVDDFALVFKGLFILVTYVVLLLGTTYIQEGDYYEGEFSFLLLCSAFGMVTMASSRDLISIFISLEMLSIPAYMLAGWRKRDSHSNEAALKYYLLGVLASAVMLYGMSIIFGISGQTVLLKINVALAGAPIATDRLAAVGILFVLVGFAFKISAVPFHNWAPDTYEGAPTPVTAFLSVASKTAGFVAILVLVFVAFLDRNDIWAPLFWTLAAVTMTMGNVIALRQKNIIRMLAYSSIAQAGYMLVPIATAGYTLSSAGNALQAVIIYLIIYAAMNLGAFAVAIAVARRTKSGEITSYAGLFRYAPGLTVAMTFFLFSLAGIPPFGGWFAKFVLFRAVADAGTTPSIVLGVVLAVNSVISLVYYANVAKQMWMNEPPEDADTSPIEIPASLSTSIALMAVITLATGVFPNVVAKLGEAANLLPR